MDVRVEIGSELYEWASERSRIDPEDLARRFPKLPNWRAGDSNPTLKQLQAFADATHTPIGMLLLSVPPVEEMPLPDFRTIGDVARSQPSADLLDVIYMCQRRQEWYKEFLEENDERQLESVGSATLTDKVVEVAEKMRAVLAFDVENRGSTWSDAFGRLAEQAEEIGILVMVSGIVGSNTHRKLNPEEFRGFAMTDPVAPLVFINGADTKAAQTFTLAHELVHIWLGQSAVSETNLAEHSENRIERWCNEVAAEFLVPLARIRDNQNSGRVTEAELDRLARMFKVSTLVVLRRIFDTDRLSWEEYQGAYATERARVMGFVADRASGGGDFYNTQPVRVSKRFARALIINTVEGRTMYHDAFRMLGFSKLSTFHKLGQRMGIL